MKVNTKKFNPRFINLSSEWEVRTSPVLCNFCNLYQSNVIYTDDKSYPFKMWLFGWSVDINNPGYPGSDAIFHARSKDLENWEVYSGNNEWDSTMNPQKWVPVMTAGSRPYDNYHNGDPSVVYKDGIYYMAFSAVGFDQRCIENNTCEYIVNCIMGATSTNGIQWTKSEAPILIWDKEFIQGWEVGTPCPPSYGGYHRPSLMFDEGIWKLWFDYYLPGTFLSMGYAENSSDFLNSDSWKILNCDENPQIKDWPNPTVIKHANKYFSFSDPPGYSKRSAPDRQITMAESMDGVNWDILGHITPEPGNFGTHLPEPFIYNDGNCNWLYVFYSWQKGMIPYDTNYKSIKYMRKRL